MLKNSIKLTDDTKSLLDEVKTKFDLKTYDTAIKTAVVFILRNEINLKDDYIGDYKKGLIDLENRLGNVFKNHEEKILKNNTSLRNWFGAMEKDYLKPLIAKLSVLDKISDYNISEISDDKINIPKIENPLNSHLKSDNVDSKPNEESKSDDSKSEEKFKEIYRKYELQKQALFKIFNNSKIESGGMMSKEKIIINLSAEEWEELKNNV